MHSAFSYGLQYPSRHFMMRALYIHRTNLYELYELYEAVSFGIIMVNVYVRLHLVYN